MTDRPSDLKHAAQQWIPILSGESRQKVWDLLASIRQAIDTLKVDEFSLANGACGMALCFAYLDSASGSNDWVSRVESMLAETVEPALASANPRAFLSGAVGIGWVFDHLERRFGLTVTPDPRPVVDYLLHESLSGVALTGLHELSQGLVGYGVYLAENIQRPRHKELLERIVDNLEATAIAFPDGVAWWTPGQNIPEAERSSYPNGYFNLGLAHGIPGVVSLLGRVCRLGVAEHKARRLLDRAAAWILGRRQPAGAGSHFCNWIRIDGPTPARRSRVGWCYGDLGVSAALYSAARDTGNAALAEKALSIARDTAGRSLSTSGLKDAAICHGAAGNCQVFNRLFQHSHETVFLDAARFYASQILVYREGAQTTPLREDMDVQDTEADTTSEKAWPDHPGIFGGLAGIALVLQAAIDPVEPEWDSILLI